MLHFPQIKAKSVCFIHPTNIKSIKKILTITKLELKINRRTALLLKVIIKTHFC